MINVVAVSLVLSSLITACVFSPTHSTTKQDDNDVVIVKEGHRAVVVEYEKEGTDGNTKVSISSKPITEEEEFSKEEVKGRGRGARELVCDAFGKCKHRIASVMGKAKEKAYEVEEGAKEAVGKAKEKVYEVEEGAKEAVGGAIGKAKETVSHATEIPKEMAEKAKTMGKDVQRNVSTTIDSMKEKTEEKAEQGKEMADQAMKRAKAGGNRVKEGGRKVLKEIRRRAQEVAAAMDWVVGVVHLLGFSTAYGICLWVTFGSSYVLSRTLPRQQFGMVQSRIYPVYFRVMAVSVFVALVGHLLGRRRKLFASKGEMLQVYHLLASLLMILINAFYLEPRATKVAFEKMKLEKEEGRGRVDPVSNIPVTPARASPTTPEAILTPAASIPEKPDQDKVKTRIARLNERLKKLNTVSSLLNIFTLVALTWHLVYLGQRLHLSN